MEAEARKPDNARRSIKEPTPDGRVDVGYDAMLGSTWYMLNLVACSRAEAKAALAKRVQP